MKVFFVKGDAAYHAMFAKAGWHMASTIQEADLVQFTGGADVHPGLYNEHKHKTTSYDVPRDTYEKLVYQVAQLDGVPCAGICRGGQFLNVMNGGKMWQDVDNHRKGMQTHEATCELSGEIYAVTSTHHQMMRPHDEGVIVLTAEVSKRRTRMVSVNREMNNFTRNFSDVEAVFYPQSNSFCFQPHPEYAGHALLAVRYFDYLDYLIFDEMAELLKREKEEHICVV